MRRTFVTLSLLSAFTVQAQQSNAQVSKRNNDQTKRTIKDVSNKSIIIHDTNHIALSPFTSHVAYQANRFSTIPKYPRLQSSLLSGIGANGNSLTESEKKHLQQFIEKYYLSNSKHLQGLQVKSSPYFSTMNKVFTQYGIPEDLKYLAVIESNLNTHARSYVGAVGTWQFMASTARFLGLTVNSHRDDRKDLYKSTVAAAKYLSQLHSMFDNWMLVIAAYNCGPGRLKQAISSSGSTNFWDLKKYLPQESQKHVMKFLATTYIMEGFADFFGVEQKELLLGNVSEAPSPKRYRTLAKTSISGKYSMAVIAKYASIDLIQLEKLNPGLLDNISQNISQSHQLSLPADKMILFKENQAKILNESIFLITENNLQKAK